MDSTPSPDEEIICQCFQVSDETIKAHIKQRNFREIEEVTEACGAGGGCQSCHMLIQLFIDQHHHPGKSQSSKPDPSDGGVKKRGIFSKMFSRF